MGLHCPCLLLPSPSTATYCELKGSFVVHFLVSERSTFKYLVLSLMQVAGFTSYFLKVCKHHRATSFCQWHLFFSAQSDYYDLPLVVSTSYLVHHTLLFLALQNPMLFSKGHHYPFSKDAHTITLHSPWLVRPKYLLNSANS